MIGPWIRIILLGTGLFIQTPDPDQIPVTPLETYNQGISLYDQGDLSGACAMWRIAMKDGDPEIARSAKFNLAVALVERQQEDQAKKQLEEFAALWPEDQDALRNLEWLMLQSGEDENDEDEKQDNQSPPPPSPQEQPQPQPKDNSPEQEPLTKEQAEKILQRTAPPRAAPPSPRRPDNPATQPW